MAVVQGNAALASDYNTLRGEVNRWFADNYAGAISFGNGNQTYGWGGSPAASVSSGNPMLASQMNTLIDMCNLGEDITSVTGQLSQISAGTDLILASQFNTIETKSDDIRSLRLVIEPGELSVTAGGTSVRSTTWSAAINCTFRYTFASFDRARYFFNSGGGLNLDGTITGYSTGTGWDGAGFNEIFTTMGTLSMVHNTTTRSGSGGTGYGLGYYDLTTSYQSMWQQTGSGAYTDAIFLAEARRSSSGNWVEHRVTLTPGAGRSVNGTTTITSDYTKLNNQTQGTVSLTITAPSYSLQGGL